MFVLFGMQEILHLEESTGRERALHHSSLSLSTPYLSYYRGLVEMSFHHHCRVFFILIQGTEMENSKGRGSRFTFKPRPYIIIPGGLVELIV